MVATNGAEDAEAKVPPAHPTKEAPETGGNKAGSVDDKV
jgi:hypothetical protein